MDLEKVFQREPALPLSGQRFGSVERYVDKIISLRKEKKGGFLHSDLPKWS